MTVMDMDTIQSVAVANASIDEMHGLDCTMQESAQAGTTDRSISPPYSARQ